MTSPVFETASAELIMAMNEPQSNSPKNDENKKWIAVVTSNLLEYDEPVDGFIDFLEILDGFDEVDKAKDFERIFKSLVAKIETEMNENYAKFNYLYSFR